MPRQSTDTCASCLKYPLEAAADTGFALCPEFESERQWNDKCVLHMPAKDRERRRAIVVKLMSKEKE